MLRIILSACTLLPPTFVFAQPEPAWHAAAARLVPAGFVAGRALRTDLLSMTGTIAVFRAGADDPKSPGSAFDQGLVLLVRLRRNAEGIEPISATLRPRERTDLSPPQEPATRESMQEFDARNRDVEAKGAALPEGAVPCALEGFSIERDRRGLVVREEPSPKSRALGTLPPPFRVRRSRADGPKEGWHTEFSIVGYKDGWFLIEGAKPPGRDYEDAATYPAKHPVPYSGRGWIPANKVGANYANGATRIGGLFQAPHVDAKWTPAKNAFGGAISADGGPKRILACSGLWALVESHDRITGWWRHLCSNQVTNCS